MALENETGTRILIVGSSSSGKSTLADQIASQKNLTHIELDRIYWKENWERLSDESFRKQVRESLPTDHWVVDGNYSATRNITWPAADTIIWLNLPFRIVFFRALARAVHRSFTGQPVCGDNRETLWRTFFSKESILLWVIQSFRRRNRELREVFDKKSYSNLTYIEIRHPRETRKLFGEDPELDGS